MKNYQKLSLITLLVIIIPPLKAVILAKEVLPADSTSTDQYIEEKVTKVMEAKIEYIMERAMFEFSKMSLEQQRQVIKNIREKHPEWR